MEPKYQHIIAPFHRLFKATCLLQLFPATFSCSDPLIYHEKNLTNTVNDSSTFWFPPPNKCMPYRNLKALTSCNQFPPRPQKWKKKHHNLLSSRKIIRPDPYSLDTSFSTNSNLDAAAWMIFVSPLRACIWDNGTAKQQRPDCAIHYNNMNKNPQKPTIGFYCWPLGFTDCSCGGKKKKAEGSSV